MRSVLAAALAVVCVTSSCGARPGQGGTGGGRAGGSGGSLGTGGGTGGAGGGSGGGGGSLGTGGGAATGGGLGTGGGGGGGLLGGNDGGNYCVPGTITEVGDGGIRIPDGGDARDGGSDAGWFTAVVAWFDFQRYSGTAEPGVLCAGTQCDAGTSCCLTCTTASCGACTSTFTTEVACDGPEDCPSLNDVCCFSVTGATCKPTAQCAITIPQYDAGAPIDGGILATALDEGVRVCNHTVDCRWLLGEVCCSSSRIQRLDVGLCIPFPFCPP